MMVSGYVEEVCIPYQIFLFFFSFFYIYEKRAFQNGKCF